MESTRIDKWLWAVRVFKTRGLATDACRRGHVLVNGMEAKPSREVREGDSITVKKMPVIYSYLIRKVAEKRMAASLVPDFAEDRTSLEELEKLKVKDTFFIKRERGTGRPTKKERRDIDRLTDTYYDE